MNFSFEKYEDVGIFKLTGHITADHEDTLKLMLMRAVHSMDRAVLNLKDVSVIDSRCLRLLKKAYRMSVRLKNPIILTEVPAQYITEIFDREIKPPVKHAGLTNQDKGGPLVLLQREEHVI